MIEYFVTKQLQNKFQPYTLKQSFLSLDPKHLHQLDAGRPAGCMFVFVAIAAVQPRLRTVAAYEEGHNISFWDHVGLHTEPCAFVSLSNVVLQ